MSEYDLGREAARQHFDRYFFYDPDDHFDFKAFERGYEDQMLDEQQRAEDESYAPRY